MNKQYKILVQEFRLNENYKKELEKYNERTNRYNSNVNDFNKPNEFIENKCLETTLNEKQFLAMQKSIIETFDK